MTDLSVFIHSTGTGPSMWAGLPPAVLGGTKLVTPLNIGYAPGPPLPRGEPFSIEREVSHLLQQIGGGSSGVHLYAHSYGAVVSIKLVQLLGPRLRSLFLFEPPLFGALRHDTSADPRAVADAHRFDEMPWFLEDRERGGTDPWLEVFIDYWNRPGSWGRLPPAMKDELRAVGWKMFQEVRACFLEVTDYAEVSIPDVPCTLVTGERSPEAARAMMLALAHRIPKAVLTELPGVGHMAVVTNPKVVHRAMLAHAVRAAVASPDALDVPVEKG